MSSLSVDSESSGTSAKLSAQRRSNSSEKSVFHTMSHTSSYQMASVLYHVRPMGYCHVDHGAGSR